jgi:hypothetical protein
MHLLGGYQAQRRLSNARAKARERRLFRGDCAARLLGQFDRGK